MAQVFLYFFRTFIFTGILNVLPQMFLITHFPSYRTWLLPVYLMLYSASGVVGLWWSSRFVRDRRFRISPTVGRGLILLTAFLTNGTLFILFEIKTWQCFLAGLIVLAFLLESSFNVSDHALVDQLSESDLSRHAARASIAQLFGVCLAPMSFALGFGISNAVWVLGLMCSLFMGISYWSLSSSIFSRGHLVTSSISPGDRPNRESCQGAPEGRPFYLPPPIDLVYLLFVLSMYCGAFLFTSYGIFMLRDLYGLSQPTYGVWMITTLNVSSIVGALGYGALMRKRHDKGTSLQGGAVAAGLLLVAIILFAMRLNFHLYFVIFLAFLAGVPYGGFLVMSRAYASKRTSMTGSPLLSLYNVSADAASVTAFLVTLVVTLSLGMRHGTGSIAAPIVMVIAFLVLALTGSFGISLLKKGTDYTDWGGVPK